MSASRLTKVPGARGARRYAINGVEVPGVTDVVKGAAGDKPWLLWWAAGLTAEWARDNTELRQALGDEEWTKQARAAWNRTRDRAAFLGTAVHGHAQALLAGEAPSVSDDELPYVRQAAKFQDTWLDEVVAAERPCFSARYQYAGTFDLIAKLADGRTWLLDYKTGKGVYPEVALQLAAYRFAEAYCPTDDTEAPMPHIDACGVVHVRPDRWQLYPVQATEEREHWAFLHAIAVSWWHQATEGDRPTIPVVGPALPSPEAVA